MIRLFPCRGSAVSRAQSTIGSGLLFIHHTHNLSLLQTAARIVKFNSALLEEYRAGFVAQKFPVVHFRIGGVQCDVVFVFNLFNFDTLSRVEVRFNITVYLLYLSSRC